MNRHPNPRHFILKERFWNQVDKSGGCWIWTGSKFSNGYGEIRLPKGNVTGAHRISWILAHGEIPKGMYVCHKCDNKLCVRPDHLFLGSPQDNATDMVRKGRSATGIRNSHHSIYGRNRGSKNGRSKINENQAIEIRNRYSQGEKVKTLASEFDLNVVTIRMIIHRQIWTHI